MSTDVYVIDGKRTPFGSFGGSLSDVDSTTLGTTAIKGLLAGVALDPATINEVIIGQVLSGGVGQAPARQAMRGAGIPDSTPALTINKVCGSGLKAIMLGADSIRLGESSVVIAGGMENMSISPYMLDRARFGYRMGNGSIVDHMIRDGLTDVFNDYHMGVTAENLAERHGIGRLEQDEFALESQKRAKEAIAAGKFKDEIATVVIKGRKGDTLFDADEHPRETSMEILGKLKPAFKKDGTVTAGNSSGINDGGSATLLAGEEAVEKYGLRPLGEIVAFAQAGVDPAYMGYGPVPAIEKALKKCGMNLNDIELLELNEAFAAQSLSVIKGLQELYGVSKERLLERTNVNGGAIALGHPIGASGNRIIVTLLYEMAKRDLQFGLASLCIGGGMGTALVVKRV